MLVFLISSKMRVSLLFTASTKKHNQYLKLSVKAILANP
jgi:hypothetical protein